MAIHGQLTKLGRHKADILESLRKSFKPSFPRSFIFVLHSNLILREWNIGKEG